MAIYSKYDESQTFIHTWVLHTLVLTFIKPINFNTVFVF